jgi:hypothetical protein
MIIPPPLTEPIPQGSRKPLNGSCFACDICRSAYFRTFEEALLHENLCKQQRDRDLALAKYRAMNRKFLAQEMARKLKTKQHIAEMESGVAKVLKNKSHTVQVTNGEQLMRKRNKEQHGSSTVHAISLPTSPLTKSTYLTKSALVTQQKETNDWTVMMQNSTAEEEEEKEEGLAQLCKRTIDELLKTKAHKKTHKPLLEERDQDRWDEQKFSQLFQLLHPFYRDALSCINIRTFTENQDGHVPPGHTMVEMKCKYCSYRR